jgi:hypothetical protein
VPTPEADVTVPPPQQHAQDSSVPPQAPPQGALPSREIRRPMLVLAGVFFVFGFVEILLGIATAPKGEVDYILGYGLGQAIGGVLVLGGVDVDCGRWSLPVVPFSQGGHYVRSGAV